MKKLFTCTIVLLAVLLLLTTGTLAFDTLDPPKPGAAEGWYVSNDAFSMNDPTGQGWLDQGSTHFEYEFNNAGLPVRRIEQSAYPDGSSQADYLLEYDAQGRLVRSVQSDGNHEMRYDYRDDGSHLLTYTWWAEDETQADARTSYRTYDPQLDWYWYGDFSFEMDDKGMIARRWSDRFEYVYTTEYDGQGRVSKVTVVCTQDHTSYTDEYTYTDDGWSMRESTRTGYEEFVYDARDRLTKYIFGYDDGAPAYVYTYDSDGNCTEISNGFRRWTYAYQKAVAEEKPSFLDVTDPKSFFYTPVYWAVKNGITKGTGPDTFSPGVTCTRGQVVTFLWRAAGSPEPAGSANPFADVKEGAFYYKAVLWAVEKGVTNGIDSTHFGPDRGCTRAQVVTFLWRAKNEPKPASDANPFADVTGGYFRSAVLWAVGKNITNGVDKTHFGPNATCTRGQIVTFLYRAENPDAASRGGLVGICMPTAALMRWRNDGEALKTQIENLGYDVTLQFADNMPDNQIHQIENMLADGAKVLVISAIDGYALNPVLAKAKAAGVKVIAYDRLIYGSDAVNWYVTFSNWKVGVAQGEYIEKALDLKNAAGKTYNIEFVTGDLRDSNVDLFYGGAMSVLQKYLDSGVLVCRSGQTAKQDVATEGWSSDYACDRFHTLLTQYYADQPLHAVLASNDSTAQGVATALSDSYSNDVYPIITGQDCDILSVRNMLDGKQAMSVFKNTGDLVAKTVEMVDAVMKGNAPPVNDTETFDNGTGIIPSFLCDPQVCTRDNIKELLIDSGFYTWEELTR
ncbi:MAG: hypothetical protein E7424_05300 [Ruminococcaceae bacterium]|nr:hypothetical protein [Oscillospiraceae bacterium]